MYYVMLVVMEVFGCLDNLGLSFHLANIVCWIYRVDDRNILYL